MSRLGLQPGLRGHCVSQSPERCGSRAPRPPPARLWSSSSPVTPPSGPRTCYLCTAAFSSECHMLPNFAENRKPRQREGSPVIHQGMTVQLFVPILRARVTVQGGFLPCLPSPPPPSPLARAWTLSYHLWRRRGQTLLGPSFYLSFPAFWGGEAEECGVL